MAAGDHRMPLENGWFSSQPQLTDTTVGRCTVSLITALMASITPFSSKVEKYTAMLAPPPSAPAISISSMTSPVAAGSACGSAVAPPSAITLTSGLGTAIRAK